MYDGDWIELPGSNCKRMLLNPDNLIGFAEADNGAAIAICHGGVQVPLNVSYESVRGESPTVPR